MDYIAIFFSLIGICMIVTASLYFNRLYHQDNESKYVKLMYVNIFTMFLTGVIFISGAVTGYIELALALTIVILLLSKVYRRINYPSYSADVKKRKAEINNRINQDNIRVKLTRYLPILIGLVSVLIFWVYF